jgi:hypothetical protein
MSATGRWAIRNGSRFAPRAADRKREWRQTHHVDNLGSRGFGFGQVRNLHLT